MSDTRESGLIEAHHIVAAIAREMPKVRWWQLGRKKSHQMEILSAVSDRLYAEVTRIHDARMAEILARPRTHGASS